MEWKGVEELDGKAGRGESLFREEAGACFPKILGKERAALSPSSSELFGVGLNLKFCFRLSKNGRFLDYQMEQRWMTLRLMLQ